VGGNISSCTIGYLSSQEIDFVNDLLSETANSECSGNPSHRKFPLSLRTVVEPRMAVLISALGALVIMILSYWTREPYETPAMEQTRSVTYKPTLDVTELKELPAINPSSSLAPPSESVPPARQGVDYATLQRRLIELGYYMGPADGIWGPKSRAGLRAFKGANGLPANEEWDDMTAARLFSPRPARAPTLLWLSAKAQ
jgi:Putative peptidoglycan binding domain